jgi:hypothetical protein
VGALSKSVSRIARGAMDAFGTFPASIASALAFSIVTAVRIFIDWPQQEAYNFLFNCLHWAFAFGAVFGLASVVFVRSRRDGRKCFIAANLATAAVVAAVFLLLYFFGGREPGSDDYYKYVRLAQIAVSRMSALIFTAIVAFVILAGLPKRNPNLSRSLFMTLKAFATAAIYGGVMMGGTSAVAGAIQALLYNDMSYKVYQYLGTIVGFLTFTIFAGFFPDFSKSEEDEKRIAAQTQSKFMVVLLSNIMVPIVMALTVVLLLWTGKTVFEGVGSSFIRLSSIASSYAIGGIWLHMMVAEHDNGMARFYRRVYPVAALIILGFEAWALVVQLGKYGMKTTEYFFIIVWVVAVASVVLIILQKEKAYRKVMLISALATLISVTPFVGYHTLPAKMQSARLEGLLIEAEMLNNGQIVPGSENLDLELREGITDAVSFLAYQEDTKLPEWFDRELRDDMVFRKKMGFAQVWPQYDDFAPPSDYLGTVLTLEPAAIDISRYDWAVNLMDMYGKGQGRTEFEGADGTYLIEWLTEEGSGNIPKLRIYLNDEIILEESMEAYLEKISEKYPLTQHQPRATGLEDMSVRFETDKVDVLLVFSTTEINLDNKNDTLNYWLALNSLYFIEK